MTYEDLKQIVGKPESVAQKFSINNKLILSPYAEERVMKADIKHGFAGISQKTHTKSLTLLVGAKLNSGIEIKAGSKAHIKEELLYTQPWAKQVLSSEDLGASFIIVDIGNVEFITEE